MSIKGRPGTWLTAALERGDLATAISEASELPRLNLSDALAIVLLMADEGHPSFSRAGAMGSLAWALSTTSGWRTSATRSRR